MVIELLHWNVQNINSYDYKHLEMNQISTFVIDKKLLIWC